MRLISKANMVQIAFGGESEIRGASLIRSECGIVSCRFKTRNGCVDVVWICETDKTQKMAHYVTRR